MYILVYNETQNHQPKIPIVSPLSLNVTVTFENRD